MNFECPHCGQHYEADDSYYGKQIECQNCHGNISIIFPNDNKVITLKKNNNVLIFSIIIVISIIAAIGAIIWFSGSKEREIKSRIMYCLLNNGDIKHVAEGIVDLGRIYGNDLVEKYSQDFKDKENEELKNRAMTLIIEKYEERMEEVDPILYRDRVISDDYLEEYKDYLIRKEKWETAVLRTQLEMALIKNIFGVNFNNALNTLLYNYDNENFGSPFVIREIFEKDFPSV